MAPCTGDGQPAVRCNTVQHPLWWKELEISLRNHWMLEHAGPCLFHVAYSPWKNCLAWSCENLPNYDIFFLREERGLDEDWKAGIFGIRGKNGVGRKDAHCHRPFPSGCSALNEVFHNHFMFRLKPLFINRNEAKIQKLGPKDSYIWNLVRNAEARFQACGGTWVLMLNQVLLPRLWLLFCSREKRFN